MTSQTRRHLFIVSLLGVSQVVLAVNKMDLVDFRQSVFDEAVRSVGGYLAHVSHSPNVTAIPISALHGDNVVTRGDSMPWHTGPTIIEFLEEVEIPTADESGARLRVQNVLRPHSREYHDFRGLAGRLSGGTIAVGDEITVYPSGLSSRLASVLVGGDPVHAAEAGRSVAVTLVDDIDVGRGDVVVLSGTTPPLVTDSIVCDVCWMTEEPLEADSRWVLKIGTRVVPALVRRILGAYDIDSTRLNTAQALGLNDIGTVEFDIASRVVCDTYVRSRRSGSAILVNEATGATVAALMVRGVAG